MRKIILTIALLLLLFPVMASAEKLRIVDENTSSDNQSMIIPGVNGDLVIQGGNFTNTTEEADKKPYSDNFTDTDAYSDIAVSAWDKILLHMAEQVTGQYGDLVGFIFQFIIWNVKPWEIVPLQEFEHQMWLLVFPLSILIILAVMIARTVALSEPQGYKTMFGNVDIIQNDFVGGGLFVIIALASEGTVMAILFALDLINAYLMSSIFDSIRPNPDNAVMYFFMALIWLLLFIFFMYRQIMIVALYVIAPIFGMMFATGLFKEMVDDIGDKFTKALLMQPICIFITNIAIKVMEITSLNFFGVPFLQGTYQSLFYLALFVILLFTCIWCLFTKVNFFKRAVGLAVYRKVF
jgi:hypothetical protein